MQSFFHTANEIIKLHHENADSVFAASRTRHFRTWLFELLKELLVLTLEDDEQLSYLL